MKRQRSLPPLGALRAFEAAARLENFTQAAKELHVTQTAISHQVRSLESFYSQKLFDRQNREVVLNEAGRSLAVLLTNIFDQLEQESQALLAVEAAPLRITMPPAFGSYWLAPRLTRFWAQHTVELNLIPSVERLDFSKHNIDLGIRVGCAPWPGLQAERLMSYSAVPVCSPAYLEQAPPLRTANDLQKHKLVHETSYQPWVDWFAMHDCKDTGAKHGIVCQDPALLYELVLQGQGVALLSAEIMAEQLDNGQLVAPLGKQVDEGPGFYLIYREREGINENARLFREFILAEASLRK